MEMSEMLMVRAVLLPPLSLGQWSPTFFATGTGFVEDNFSMDQGRGWVVSG